MAVASDHVLFFLLLLLLFSYLHKEGFIGLKFDFPNFDSKFEERNKIIRLKFDDICACAEIENDLTPPSGERVQHVPGALFFHERTTQVLRTDISTAQNLKQAYHILLTKYRKCLCGSRAALYKIEIRRTLLKKFRKLVEPKARQARTIPPVKGYPSGS